jgi:hypothetical protein
LTAFAAFLAVASITARSPSKSWIYQKIERIVWKKKFLSRSLREDGEVDWWPERVFLESFEEVKALR